MARIKRGKTAHQRRKRLLKQTKGFRWARKSKYRPAKQALLHGLAYSFAGRKIKKRTTRQLWQIKIGGACRNFGLNYNKFIYLLKKNNIELDRKILSLFVVQYPEIFKKIIETVKK